MRKGFERNVNPAVSSALLTLPRTLIMASDDCSEKCSDHGASNVPTNPTSIDAFSHLVRGYPMLAGRMGVLPEIAMFRRFGALNARNLLYLQNELICLEEELILWEKKDNLSSTGRKKDYAGNAYWLNSSYRRHKDGSLRDGDTKQRDLFHQIKQTLNEYNHALIQQATVLQMKEPDKFDLTDIQHFLAGEPMRLCLCGPDSDVYGSVLQPKDYSHELVVLHARRDSDSFSRILGNHALNVLHTLNFLRWRKPNPKLGVVSFSDQKIFKFTFWLTSAIACVIPVASIAVLTTVRSLSARLGTIAGFNALISLCLSFFTDARRADVFSITAA
ncbi:hypothetical protein C7974DRAFT_464372 [Boeremia exigua]|uniref:uncharacterized protein n=1 Tax=Boeremia exigua TaxID=749465 RepID=UPI001E8D8325|nr:uncharacterized protein C7974DRAFT_464372 [Boeremia exigua]KAH6621929.1 hypothetical protein C7974DRAFT_464372 [Boeremia exigua]